MAYRSYEVLTVTMPSGETTSTEVDLLGHYAQVYVNVPAGSVGDLEVWGSDEKNGTFLPIYASGATVAFAASSVSNMYVNLAEAGYMRFTKLVASTAPANGATYKFVCID